MDAMFFTIADFNPRSPYGERLPFCNSSPPIMPFQSTLPIRGATDVRRDDQVAELISIHAPHTGSDLDQDAVRVFSVAFQSTLPIRGATACPG